jgi:hypothetical protein
MRPPLHEETQLLTALVRRALTSHVRLCRSLNEAQLVAEAVALVAIVDPSAERRLCRQMLRVIGDAVGAELCKRRAEARERLNELADTKEASHDE